MTVKYKSLYRPEYLEKQKTANNGEILVKPTFNQNLYLLFSILILVTIAIFITFADYTRRETLVGIVSPIGGTVKVKSNNSGYIQNIFVKEGDKVDNLTPLYVIKTERLENQLKREKYFRAMMLHLKLSTWQFKRLLKNGRCQ